MNGSVRGKEWRQGIHSLTVPYSLLVQIWPYRWWGNITIAIQIPASDGEFLLNKANWNWYEVLGAIFGHICSWANPSRNIDFSKNVYLCKCDISPTFSVVIFPTILSSLTNQTVCTILQWHHSCLSEGGHPKWPGCRLEDWNWTFFFFFFKLAIDYTIYKIQYNTLEIDKLIF